MDVDYKIREAHAPLPPGWKPGQPLPDKYKLHKVIKEKHHEKFSYRQSISKMLAGITRQNSW